MNYAKRVLGVFNTFRTSNKVEASRAARLVVQQYRAASMLKVF